MSAGVVVSDIAHEPAFDAKPVPETVTVKVPVPGTVAIEGDTVIEGKTVKMTVPLSGPHVTVRVTPAPFAPAGPGPTTKDPYTVAPITQTYLFVMTELPVIEQLVPSIAVVTVPAVIIITSPSFPLVGLRVSPVMAAACAFSGGTATVAIETNSSEVRSSTINSEPELRLVNLRHAVMMSRVRHI
jgi:hypothetical protein